MVDKIIEAAVKAALSAVERTKPSGVYFGKVISISPIKISIDQKLILTEEFIVLGRYITEFSVDLTVTDEMWHGLRKNDELLLVREQGGQRYCVVDWVKRVEEDTRPAWIKEGEVTNVSPLEIKVNDYLTLKGIYSVAPPKTIEIASPKRAFLRAEKPLTPFLRAVDKNE